MTYWQRIGGILLIMGLFSFGIMGCSGNASDAVNGIGKRGYVVGGKITEDNFSKFYYTYSTTTNPPEFQRYLFYVEDGRKMFYHEKREGDKVFLTEDDITVSGTMELTAEEWDRFWGTIEGSAVKKRVEDTKAGGSGPWLYLYWDGDKDKYQEFSFNDYESLKAFEDMCIELKNKQLEKE